MKKRMIATYILMFAGLLFAYGNVAAQAEETKIREKDEMTMVYVPAGEFAMGDEKGVLGEKPVHAVNLSAYWIDKHEVTNGQYARCVSAGVCAEPYEKTSAKQDSYYGNDEFADFPVINVDWNQAKAYCEWVGGDLPTEAQWEKAARGADGRIYPWGDEINRTKANHISLISVGDTTKACSYAEFNSPYGACDMAGNVWEWVNDWYDEAYYAKSPNADPQGPESGFDRVRRGGSWGSEFDEVRAYFRWASDPADWTAKIGFRCRVDGQ